MIYLHARLKGYIYGLSPIRMILITRNSDVQYISGRNSQHQAKAERTKEKRWEKRKIKKKKRTRRNSLT